jgi:hypothetical protein
MTIKKGVEDERNDGRGRWSAQGLASTLRWAVLGLLAFAACNGDGCDGCGGCDGGCDSGGCAGTPYPANAPSVTRGAQVRLTPQAFDFLEGAVEPLLGDLLGDTGTTFCVPEGSNPTLCNARTCPSTGETGCELSLSIDDVQIEAIEPNRVQASVVLGGLNQETDFLELDLATAVSCILRLGTVNDAGIPASINASFSVDPATRDVKLNLNPSDIQIDFNALDIDIDPVSILDFLACEGIDLVLGLDFLRDAIFDGIAGPLGEGISAATSGLLCVGCTSTTDCPSGSECLTDPTDEERSLCYVGGDTAQCVARPLGFEDVIDIGQLLSGTIPGLEAELAFQIKAHDYADVVEDGFSLGMKLGAYADKAACVPPAPVPTPLEVPRSVLLQGNLGPTGQPFHLGLGLSKAGLDEALWGVYNSGTLCLSAGSSLSDLLSTQTIGLLMPSLRDLTGPSVAPVYLQLVPSKPPTAIIGAGTIDPDSGEIIDPLLTLEVKDLSIDFYAFAHERYVRVMRITSDLRVPLGLNPTEEGLLIVLGDLTQAFQNVRVSESELLKETPDSLAGLIPQLVGIALPLLGDSLFSPIEIPEFQGFTLDLENSVLQGIENNSMLGIFALLALAPDGQQAQAPRVETHVELLDLWPPPPPPRGPARPPAGPWRALLGRARPPLARAGPHRPLRGLLALGGGRA